jgi:hypothetical protein
MGDHLILKLDNPNFATDFGVPRRLRVAAQHRRLGAQSLDGTGASRVA